MVFLKRMQLRLSTAMTHLLWAGATSGAQNKFATLRVSGEPLLLCLQASAAASRLCAVPQHTTDIDPPAFAVAAVGAV
jgi:hypothetical protein